MQRPEVHILGVPLDLGAGRRGVDMGPSAMRMAGLASRIDALGYPVIDAGNVPTPVGESLHGPGDPSARFLSEISDVLDELAGRVRVVRRGGGIPLVLGGDHSIALGTVSGMTGAGGSHRASAGVESRIGLIWVDAHADANTPETSPSGNLHGMPLAALFGHGAPRFTRVGEFAPGAPRLNPANTALIGVRSVDHEEAAIIAELGVRVYTMEEVDRRGIYPVVDEAVVQALDGTDGLHLSVDVDALDPGTTPGVGTPVFGGLTCREAHTIMERVAASGGLRSIEVVEVNPILDVRNSTAAVAVDLVASAFGQRILPIGTGMSAGSEPQ